MLALVAGFFVDPRGLRIGGAPVVVRAVGEAPAGRRQRGRDLLAVLVQGTPPTYLIGFIAGLIGTGLGTIVGLMSGYARGFMDTTLRGIVDVVLGIPAPRRRDHHRRAPRGRSRPGSSRFVIAFLIWAFTARQIRSQVLSMREQNYILISRLSSQGALSIMFTEILPNLLPFVMAAFVVGDLVLDPARRRPPAALAGLDPTRPSA